MFWICEITTLVAVAVVDSKAHVIIKLCGSGVTSVVDESGKEVDMKRLLE